jgi:hypothetical protein
MKYRAPDGVTALFCAGESIAPNEAGVFEAAEFLAPGLAAHGCVAVAEPEAGPTRGRSRGERAS